MNGGQGKQRLHKSAFGLSFGQSNKVPFPQVLACPNSLENPTGKLNGNLLLQAEVIPTCRELGIGIVPYSPLGENPLHLNIPTVIVSTCSLVQEAQA